MMTWMTEALPKDVVTLLERLESVLQLEILISLHDSDEPLMPAQLTRRIGGSVDQATQCLSALVGQGLAVRHGEGHGASFSYLANHLDGTVDRLAELYITRKVRVVAELLRSV
jgi:hypothetical protein